jgi:hypothetical protein
MKLTKKQRGFLDEVCDGEWTLNENGEVDVDGTVDMRNMNLTEIPVKFGEVKGEFSCSYNNLTTLKNCPTSVPNGGFSFLGNSLNGYFQNTKEKDFPLWKCLYWGDVLEEYPFLINHCKKYNTFKNINISHFLDYYPLTKLYYRD